MKKLMMTGLSLLAFGLCAAEIRVEGPATQLSTPPPEIVTDAMGDAMVFTAGASDATAARIEQAFDFSNGGRIEVEFMEDATQANPFPRIVDSPAISLHLECNPQSAGSDKVFKALLTDADRKRNSQIKATCRYREGAWHKAVFELDPAGGVYSLSLDGGEVQYSPLTVKPKLGEVRFVLGATSLKGSTRGFNGRIRNLRITTPWRIDNPSAQSALVQVSPGVRHVTICAMKGRHLAFPGAAVLPGGLLGVVFREGEGHVCPYGRICIAYSRDGGRNWSAPVAVADSASDERDPSIQTLADGRVLLTHGGWNSWMAYDSTATRYPGETAYVKQTGEDEFGGSQYLFSRDGGHTFEAPVKVPAFAPHGPAVAKDGSFYQPSLENEHGRRQVCLYRGTPDARKWTRIATIAEKAPDVGNYEEPHTVILDDGTMVTAIRVPPPGDGYMRISRSTDGGVTWSQPVRTPVRGFPQHLLQLKDGRLLATYGYRYAPQGIRACISRDGGLTWDIDKEIIIRNDGGTEDLGYPVAVEMPSGEVFCVYYMNDARHDDCFIEGAFFKP